MGEQGPLVYDCFPFYNEFERLEIRLNELADVVDYHVLVEGTKTLQGDQKPLYFGENQSRFEEFEEKIIHIVVDDYPARTENDAWEREFFTRNSILRGLDDCAPTDRIIISDADEIPRPSVVEAHTQDRRIILFGTREFRYFLNCVHADESFRWLGPSMLSYQDLTEPRWGGLFGNTRNEFPNITIGYTPQNTRRKFPTSVTGGRFLSSKMRGRIKAARLSVMNLKRVVYRHNGGWHFSFLGGVEAIVEKFETYAHEEFNTSKMKDRERIKEKIRKGEDLLGEGDRFERIEVGAQHPTYIRQQPGKFGEYLL